MTLPSVTVVTPWHNHRELERDYWAALLHTDAQVIVVDNGSDPPLPNAWRLPTNTGFSHASNVGLELARTDAVVFLNNDVRMTAPGWLDRLRVALEPGVLAGPVLRFDPHGDVDGMRLPYLDGWCLAGMRDDLVELGGWDEGFEEPSYYGDNDLCLRARAAGMLLREVPFLGLEHLCGRTTQADGFRLAATSANYRRFAERARGLLGVAA